MFKKFDATIAFILLEIALACLAIYFITPVRDIPYWWYPLSQTLAGIIFLAIYFFCGKTYVVESEYIGVPTFSKTVLNKTKTNSTYYGIYPWSMKIIRISPDNLKIVMEYAINDNILMKFSLGFVFWVYDAPKFAKLDKDDTLKTLGGAIVSAMKATIADKELYRAEFKKEEKTHTNNVMRQLVILGKEIEKRLSELNNPYGSTGVFGLNDIITFPDLAIKIKHLTLDADFANEQTQKDMYERTKEKLQSEKLQEQNLILLETVAGLVALGVDKELATLAGAAATDVPSFVQAKTYLLGNQLPQGLLSLGEGGSPIIANAQQKGGGKK